MMFFSCFAFRIYFQQSRESVTFINCSGEVITMVTKETCRSIPDILRPFREYLQSMKLADGIRLYTTVV